SFMQINQAKTDEVLSRHLEDLRSEKARTEAHLQSLKKRSANLSVTADTMKQQISEKYEAIRKALHKDEMAMLETIEEDQRVTSAKLNKIMKEWSQHLGQVQRAMANTQNTKGIKMNEDRFQRLLKILHNISKDLEAQMHRKVLLLGNCFIVFNLKTSKQSYSLFVPDSSAVTIDSKSSHRNIAVSRDQRSMCYSSEPQPLLDSPLQFDKVCCALGSASLSKGRHYWEVDLSCCSAWSVGIAYGSIERKGNQKNAKLGRNRHSWCIEFRDNQLSAWHNDHYISCGKSQVAIRKVGMLVDCQKGQLAFYNAVTMKLLQEF
uniref:Si:dkey-219e21.4 n=1 Tax=Lepisosteus oculatus TaxID=7918 RepID=W5N6F4_LEPOC